MEFIKIQLFPISMTSISLIILLEEKKKSFKSIIKKDILDFLESLKIKNVKNKTKSRKIFALKRFYRFLVSEKVIENNPIEKIDIPKSEDTLSITLTADQIEKILNFVSKSISPAQRSDKSNIVLLNICSINKS